MVSPFISMGITVLGVLTGIVLAASGAAMLAGHSSSESGSCCIPKSCDGNVLKVRLDPGRSHVCNYTEALAAEMGCLGTADALNGNGVNKCAWNLSRDYLCDTNSLQKWATATGVISILAGVFMAVFGVLMRFMAEDSSFWRQDKKRTGLGIILLVLIAFALIAIYICDGFLVHRIFSDPFYTSTLSVCTQHSGGGSKSKTTRRCISYGYPTFTSTCSALDDDRAILYSWVADSGGYEAPSVVIIVTAAVVPVLPLILWGLSYVMASMVVKAGSSHTDFTAFESPVGELTAVN